MKPGPAHSIARQVSRHAASIFLGGSLIQTSLVLLLLVYLSYRDVIRRADFLAAANEKSLGLMLSSGDIFQLRMTVNSFVNASTPHAWIMSDEGEDLLGLKIPSYQGQRFLIDDGLLIATPHKIVYNAQPFGTLILVNRVQITDWILVAAGLLILTLAFSFFQSKMLERFSLTISQAIDSLSIFFDHAGSAERLDLCRQDRPSTRFHEVESMAGKLFHLLKSMIQHADLEKEAAVGRITKQISHDLRAPLHSFEGLLHLPDETPMASQKMRIAESLHRLHAMIESLRHADLELLIEPRRQRFDLAPGLIGLREHAARKNIHISTQLSPCELFIDAPKFERAWVNIACNAIDFARREVRIEILVDEHDFCLRVSDDGPGVPEAFLPRLFQRGATFGKADGTGLGLAYARQILRAHGGDVVYLRKDGFSIFECRLRRLFLPKEERTKSPLKNQRMVAICLLPSELSTAIKNQLSCDHGNPYQLTADYAEADIVVTNDEEWLFRAIDDGKDPIEIKKSLSETQILDRLRLRFSLHS